jgi:hypothetical protein
MSLNTKMQIARQLRNAILQKTNEDHNRMSTTGLFNSERERRKAYSDSGSERVLPRSPYRSSRYDALAGRVGRVVQRSDVSTVTRRGQEKE